MGTFLYQKKFKLHIIYYHQHFSTPDGSVGTRSYEFSKVLIERGHKVTVVTGRNSRSKINIEGKFKRNKRIGYVDGIRIIEINIDYKNSFSFFKRIFSFLYFSIIGIQIALKEDYDIIVATSTPLTAGIPGIFAKLFRKKVFVFEVRDLWPELPKAMGVIKNPIILIILDFLERSTYYFSNFCIGLSPGIVDGIKKKSPKKKVYMIPNSCDFQLVNNNISLNKKNKFIAAFTGAHGRANGLDSVLNAASILLDRNIENIEIQFIGEGLVKQELIIQAENKKLTNCKFLNPMPKKILFKYLKENIDLGLMILDNIPAFYYGTSPNKFFDYLSLGLPVLNNYPGWVADLITQNKCGVAIDPDNPYLFADTLIKFRDNIYDKNQMGLNALKLGKSQFDRKKMAEKFANALES